MSSVYNTNSYTTVNVPVTITRYINKSVFVSNGYQFNSYTVRIEDSSYNHFTGRIAYEETNYTNSSLLLDTFTTDFPLTSLTKKVYFHPITNQYINEIYFELNSTSIQLHHPYYFNFTGNISLKNNQGIPVKTSPRIFFALDQWRSPQAGDVGTSAVLPSSLLPAKVTYASASTDVSNTWTYQHDSQLKVIFNQRAQLLNSDGVGIYKDGAWYLDTDGSGTWNAGTGPTISVHTGWTSVPGDWNGDGKSEIGVYQNGVWYQDYNGNGVWDAGVENVSMFGASAWTPTVGDWNGNGKTTIGVYKDGVWYLDRDGSGTWSAGDTATMYRASGWTPVTGNWNGDASGTKIGVYKDGAWYLDNDGSGTWNAGDMANNFGV